MSSRHRTEEWFGPIDNLATYVRASQHIQAEGLQYASEAHRRRKGQCAGSLPWHFAEPWPNACDTCSVDAWDQPKPAYFSMARSYRPVHVSAKYARVTWANESKFSAQLWGHNSTDAEFGGSLITTVATLSGEIIATQTSTVSVKPESTLQWDEISLQRSDLPELFVLVGILTDEDGREISRHWSIHSTAQGAPFAPLRYLSPADVKASRGEGTIEISNCGSSVAIGLWLETPLDEQVLLSDNWLCLMPGESVQVQMEGESPEVRLSAWNLPEVRI